MKKSHHIWGIDIFRGIAALLVFLFHYYTFFSGNFSSDFFGISLLKAGHLGVDIFFVLSGFLVMLSLFFSQNFWDYAQKRLRRIVPLAFAVIFALFLYKREFFLENFLDFLVHIFFLQGFFSEYYHSINPVMWTLSVEMLFYIVIALLWLGIAKKNTQKFLGIISVLVVMSFCWRGYVFYAFPEVSAQEKIFLSEQLWGRFDQFFLGVILAFITIKNQKFSVFFRYIFLILGLGIFLSSYYIFAVLESSFRDFFLGQVFLHFAVGLGFFLFLLWFIQTEFSGFFKKKSSPFLFLGKISYGIYVFHFPILSLIHKIGNKISEHSHSVMVSYIPEISFFLALVLTIIFSYFSYEFFEKRFLKR